jgi:uncharacterized protein (DUF924 family)
MAEAEAERVLAFWFDGPAKGKHYWCPGGPQEQAQLDALISAEFAPLIEKAVAGELEQTWTNTARGSLALILLIDQFCRNVFRGTPQAFAHDALAQRWCLLGMERGQPAELASDYEREFFHMPLFHAENVDLLQKALGLLDEGCRFSWGVESYARKRLEEMEQFGRFPSRNAARGLASTASERAAGYD